MFWARLKLILARAALRKHQQTLKWLLGFDYDCLIFTFHWFISIGNSMICSDIWHKYYA